MSGHRHRKGKSEAKDQNLDEQLQSEGQHAVGGARVELVHSRLGKRRGGIEKHEEVC